MQLQLIWAALLSAYVLSRIAEWRIHSVNYKILSEAGAEERITGLMRAYYGLGLVFPLIALGEQALFKQTIFRELLTVGILLVALGFGLRFWAIGSLGPFWSMRCLGLRGMRALNQGPYKYLDNPEYISRVMETFGFGLATGAWVSMTLCLVLSIAMTLKIIAVEQGQLAAQASQG